MKRRGILRAPLALALGIVLCALACCGRCSATTPNPIAEWTFLIFMNGDNNLEPDALINFRQMARVGSTDKVNVVVQFDRIGKDAHTQPDWTQTLRFRVTKGMEPLPANAVEDIGEANMGDGKTLADFVTWGKKKYPAKKYMLVIWDHGQGWRIFVSSLLERQRSLLKTRGSLIANSLASLRSASVQLRNGSGLATTDGQTAPFRSAPGDSYRSASNDETDKDVLYNREIEDALKTILGGHKLDVIGFDACLIAMVETAYAFRDVALYMVGSEELEPGLGWNYEDLLRDVIASPSRDAAALAKAVTESYRRTYTDPNMSAISGGQTTLSAIDLSKIQPLATSLSLLCDTLMSNLAVELQLIVAARVATSTYAPGYEFHHVDLYRLMGQLAARTVNATVRAQAQTVQSQLTGAVIANYAGSERQGTYGSQGLAIYFPSSQHDHLTDPYSEGGYEKSNQLFPVEFVQRERWTDFLHAMWKRVP